MLSVDIPVGLPYSCRTGKKSPFFKMVMDLSRTGNRSKLKPRREPYWQRLGVGRFIGFRPSKGAGVGTFVCKFHEPGLPRIIHSLGDFANLSQNKRFSAAKQATETWFDHVSAGGSTQAVTVREVCERYAATHPEAARRFERHVYGSRLASTAIHKLRKAEVLAWREHLSRKPAPVTRSKSKAEVTRPRSSASLNRDMVPLRAALNKAKDDGLVIGDAAWSTALRPVKDASRRRNLYLDRQQRQQLLKHLAGDVVPFVRALCLLPLRPGALAALRVGDFDARRSELLVARDKNGEDRKILVPAQTAALLKEQTRGKLPAAPLFARADGVAWNKATWRAPIREAVKAAKLPTAVTAYVLRHSTITDLVTGGLDLLTVAQVSGTSVSMIEKHYAHLQRQHAADALAGLVL